MLKALSVGLCLWAVVVSGTAWAVEVDLDKIAMIESSGIATKYNPKSNAVGKYQITLPCLKDYNLAHLRSGYSHDEMYDPIKARKVADWYFEALGRYLKAFGLEDTLTNRLMAYNWGIGNVRRHYTEGLEIPKETRDYLVKYDKLK